MTQSERHAQATATYRAQVERDNRATERDIMAEVPEAARVMVADLRHRLEIAEAGWTKARMDTDAMTREIEGLKSSVGALLDAMRLERREEDGVTTIWADYIDDSLIADVVRRLKGGEVAG